MRNPAGELSDCLHLLRLEEALALCRRLPAACAGAGERQGERSVDREHERSSADERVPPRPFCRRAEPLRGRGELAPDFIEDHEGLVGDLVRLDLFAGLDRTKLSFEDRTCSPAGVPAARSDQSRCRRARPCPPARERTPLPGSARTSASGTFAASGSASQGRFCASESRDSICETSSCACFWRSPEWSRARMAPSTARTRTSPPTCMSTTEAGSGPAVVG